MHSCTSVLCDDQGVFAASQEVFLCYSMIVVRCLTGTKWFYIKYNASTSVSDCHSQSHFFFCSTILAQALAAVKFDGEPF